MKFYKKRADVGMVFLAGYGRVSDDRILTGDLDKYVPSVLEEITPTEDEVADYQWLWGPTRLPPEIKTLIEEVLAYEQSPTSPPLLPGSPPHKDNCPVGRGDVLFSNNATLGCPACSYTPPQVTVGDFPITPVTETDDRIPAKKPKKPKKAPKIEAPKEE